MKQTLSYRNDTSQDSRFNTADSTQIYNEILTDDSTQACNENHDKSTAEDLTQTLGENYYEILFSIHCEDTILSDIITQALADRILENGEAVEFLEKDMIEIVSDKES